MITKIYGRNLTDMLSVVSHRSFRVMLSLALLAMPLCASAQDDADDEDEPARKRTIVKKQKQYDTRTVRGRVVDAATRQAISGAIVNVIGGSDFPEEDKKQIETMLCELLEKCANASGKA